jgi:hypothetical protein
MVIPEGQLVDSESVFSDSTTVSTFTNESKLKLHDSKFSVASTVSLNETDQEETTCKNERKKVFKHLAANGVPTSEEFIDLLYKNSIHVSN